MTAVSARPNCVPGQEIGPLLKTPTNVSMFMYSAAVWLVHRIHYDRRFSMEHEALPDVVVQGTLATDWFAQLLLEWGGAQARVSRLNYQIRSYMLPDEMLTCGGAIRGVREADDGSAVDIDLWIRKPDGTQAVVGSASVVFPRADA